MGCIHGKCCSRYPPSSNGDSHNVQDIGPYNGDDTHENENHRFILTDWQLGFAPVPSQNFSLEFSVLSQRGYYPDSPDKENQDSFCIKTQIQGNPNLHLFGVFDGHGHFGTQCSNFVSNKLVEILSNDPALAEDPIEAYNSAFLATNSELHDCEIDDTMSGTTAITVLVSGGTLFVANAGDSRAVIAVKNGNRVIAEDLSHDQTPFRNDEYERVKLCGARVLSLTQVEGLMDQEIQTWDNPGDPPRLWVHNGTLPGTAFTRSIGDSTAEKIGVIAVPEVSMIQLTPNHLFFVVASDGVFEFLSSQAVVDMVLKYTDPRDACSAIAGESYKLWLEHEIRTDDITIIIVQMKGLSNSVPSATDGMSMANANAALLVTGNGAPDKSLTTGSVVYHSMRCNFSELHSCQLNIPAERNPACVVPSLTQSLSLEMVGLSYSAGYYNVAVFL